MKQTLIALAVALSIAGSAVASGETDLATADLAFTVDNIDPAVNGEHTLLFLVWLDAAGQPQFALVVDGEEIREISPTELPALPEAPGAPEVPAPELPAPGAPAIPEPPAAGIPTLPVPPAVGVPSVPSIGVPGAPGLPTLP